MGNYVAEKLRLGRNNSTTPDYEEDRSFSPAGPGRIGGPRFGRTLLGVRWSSRDAVSTLRDLQLRARGTLSAQTADMGGMDMGIGSAFSTVGLERFQNVCDYREYSNRVLGGESAISSTEILTPQMKRAERIALSLRTGDGIPSAELEDWPEESREFIDLGLLREVGGNFILTSRGSSAIPSLSFRLKVQRWPLRRKRSEGTFRTRGLNNADSFLSETIPAF